VTRLLHVAETIAGGIASYLDEIIPHQSAELGKDNIALLVPGDQVTFLEMARVAQAFTFKRAGRSAMSLIRFWLETQSVIRAYRPDIVHAHSSFAGLIVRLSPAVALTGVKIVYCAHGWAFLQDFPPWKKSLFALVERVLSWWTAAIVAVSQHEYDGAVAAGIAPCRLHLIRTGIAAAPPHAAPAAGDSIPMPVRRTDDDPLSLLYVGRLDYAKGFDLLLRSFGRIEPDKAVLFVCGAAVHDEMPERLPENIRFLGWVARDRLASLYAAADIVVIPSRSEALGLVAVEAMRAGTPVVASMRGALPEVVEDGVTGLLFDPFDENSLAATLSTLDRPTLDRLGEAGRRRFEEHFTARQMNRSLIELYESLMPSRR